MFLGNYEIIIIITFHTSFSSSLFSSLIGIFNLYILLVCEYMQYYPFIIITNIICSTSTIFLIKKMKYFQTDECIIVNIKSLFLRFFPKKFR